jgi:hypothetical protein
MTTTPRIPNTNSVPDITTPNFVIGKGKEITLILNNGETYTTNDIFLFGRLILGSLTPSQNDQPKLIARYVFIIDGGYSVENVTIICQRTIKCSYEIFSSNSLSNLIAYGHPQK